MKKISIIEFPSNLGLIEPSAGKEPGVKKMPEWFRKHNFHKLIKPDYVQKLAPPPYSMALDPESSIRNADSIIEYAKEQESFIRAELAAERFPIVLGGDCSILIGNALALRKNGCYGLFYLDGHTDFMEINLSQSGGAAGMGAAIAAGYGHVKLTNIYGLRPYIKEKHIWCVGNREYDDEYINEILKTKANYISLESLREEGMVKCAESFLEMIEAQELDGFWLHIDVDVLDDDIMPAVDSRAPGGLTYGEFNELTETLLSSSKITGMEITIFDPDLDPAGVYAKEFIHNFVQSFNNAKKRKS